MNKYKKIAAIAVTAVMAGSMVFALTGCDKNKNKDKLELGLDADGKLTWAEGTTLNLSIGHNKLDLGTHYSTANVKKLTDYLGGSTSATLYGTAYAQGNMKPAWAALASQLKLNFADKYTGQSSDNQLKEITDSSEGLAGVDIFTSSASDLANQAARNGTSIVDLNQYLDYMPNYKAFLESNKTTRLSLTADETGAMYMAPYFDGNDDIEKYVLLRKDLVEDMLNGSSRLTGTVSFATQAAAKTSVSGAGAGTSASVQAFMGTADWDIDVTDPTALVNYSATAATNWGSDLHKVDDAKKTSTVKVYVKYSKALESAKTGAISTLLAEAGVGATDISGQTSGNIIDIMNLAINKSQGAVTGEILTEILKEYIKVTYVDKDNNSFYGATGRHLSEVFNSAYAAWDADLYTALGRCFVTSGTALGTNVKTKTEDRFLLTGRQSRTDRFNDTVAMAGELYGVRGLESRYPFSYINAKGELVDARTKEVSFSAMNNINALTKEGLYAPLVSTVTITGDQASHSGADNKGIQTLTLHDYVQTQTAKQGFKAENTVGDQYNFAPVLTPVSKWDTNDDGTKDTIMRFTESWRSVKTTGFAISYQGVKNNPDKLSAALAFVDYFFSPDGQILMTYGPQASANDNGSVTAAGTAGNGFWYATEATGVSLTSVADKVADATNYAPAQYKVKDANKSQYFIYNGKVYTGTPYNGRQIPTMTASNLIMFHKVGKDSFTGYAREIIGTTLPIGNKDQGFEYQCSAKCGLAGADIVGIALNNGTVKHVVQQIATTTENATNWYTVVPSVLTYTSDVLASLSTATTGVVTGFYGDVNLFVNGSGSSGNFWHDIMAYGLGANKQITLKSADKLPADAAACITYLNTFGMNTFGTEMNNAYKALLNNYSAALSK